MYFNYVLISFLILWCRVKGVSVLDTWYSNAKLEPRTLVAFSYAYLCA